MPIPIFLITHEHLGDTLLAVCKKIITPLPTEVATLPVEFSCDAEEAYQQALKCYQQLEKPEGVLILTDLCGATPANIAHRLHKEKTCHVVSGVNLAMLLRALNYCTCPLADLSAKAAEGGHSGIKVHT